jgi:hypothetical protein
MPPRPRLRSAACCGAVVGDGCGSPEGKRKVICPNCGAEYRLGFTRCSDCLVDLVEPGSQSEPVVGPEPVSGLGRLGGHVVEPDRRAALSDPVCVFRSSQRGRLPLAESLLQSAGIPFVVLGEYVQQLTGINAYGLAELHVSAADADDARAVLADLDGSSPG